MSFDLSNALPSNLEAVAVAAFDKLVDEGKVNYQPPRIDVVQIEGFQFHFSTTAILRIKPVLPPDAPGRTKAVGPFVNPPEESIVARIGQTHKLIVNKYCVYRPMLILHTSLFVPQTDDLDKSDVEAAWNILNSFKTPQMIIYNCGVEAGSSQGHKHLQIFPRQESAAFQMFPSRAVSTEEVTTDIEGVPFKHFIVRLPNNASADHIFAQYKRILPMVRQALREASAGGDYNLILVSEWLALLPRRSKGDADFFIANAANMVGMMWMTDDELRNRLIDNGLLGLLASLGIPVS